MARKKNDILWKGILEEVFGDLLQFVFPHADQIFDLSKGFEFLDKELAEMYPQPEKKSDTRFVDKLVKVYKKDGSEEWVLCHVEVQGSHDPAFAERMFRYYCRIFDRYDRPLTAIAIFTGKDAKKLPGTYSRKYEGAEITYKYNTLCILDYDDQTLAENQNPFAIVLLAAKKALLKGKDLDEILLKEKLKMVKLLIDKGFSEQKTMSILSFLHNYLHFAKAGTFLNFTQQLDRITGKQNTMGILEQVRQMKIDDAAEKARREEKRQIIKRLLARHFSVKDIAFAADVTPSFVERIKKTLK